MNFGGNNRVVWVGFPVFRLRLHSVVALLQSVLRRRVQSHVVPRSLPIRRRHRRRYDPGDGPSLPGSHLRIQHQTRNRTYSILLLLHLAYSFRFISKSASP